MSDIQATIDGGHLRINVYDLLGSLTGEDRLSLIDTLACREEIINEVMNQVLDGCTTLGSYGPTGARGNAEATYGVDGARMRIAKMAGEVHRKEIEGMHQRIKSAEELGQKGWDAYHELLRQGR